MLVCHKRKFSFRPTIDLYGLDKVTNLNLKHKIFVSSYFGPLLSEFLQAITFKILDIAYQNALKFFERLSFLLRTFEKIAVT